VKILEVFRTAALILIAAGLFTLSYVFYEVMGKHGRYAPVSYEEEQIIVMDTHTGYVWSKGFELKDTTDPQAPNPIKSKTQRLSNPLIVKIEP
jgi:hypothetical protein